MKASGGPWTRCATGRSLEDMVEKGDMPWDRKVSAEQARRNLLKAG